jgi:hypothetical protein
MGPYIGQMLAYCLGVLCLYMMASVVALHTWYDELAGVPILLIHLLNCITPSSRQYYPLTVGTFASTVKLLG